QPREFGITGAKNVGGAAQDTPALDRLQSRPAWLRCARSFDGQLDDVGCAGVQPGDRLASCGVDDVERSALVVFDEATVAIVRGLWLGFRSHRSLSCQRGLIQGSRLEGGSGVRPRMWSAAFSPVMIEGALRLPLVTRGKIEESATRRPSTPITRHSGSTTFA